MAQLINGCGRVFGIGNPDFNLCHCVSSAKKTKEKEKGCKYRAKWKRGGMKKIVISLLSFSFVASGLWAGPVNITITDPNLQSYEAAAKLESSINKNFHVPDMGKFLNAMANAQAIANKGQGVSYATEHSLFVIGGSFGVGLSSENPSDLSATANGGLPSAGAGVLASGMVGLSFSKFPVPSIGPVDLKKFTVFVNFFSYEDKSSISSLTAKTNSFGVHLQYKLIESRSLPFGFLNWGGVAITTGFDVSSNSLNYKVGTEGLAVDVGYNTMIHWKPDNSSALALDASAFTVPVEISTSVRLLYALSFFGGAALDFNTGKSSISAKLNGTISSTGAVNNNNAGSAGLNIEDTGSPTIAYARAFLGLQLNIIPLKSTNMLSAFVQANISNGISANMHGGVRIAW